MKNNRDNRVFYLELFKSMAWHITETQEFAEWIMHEEVHGKKQPHEKHPCSAACLETPQQRPQPAGQEEMCNRRAASHDSELPRFVAWAPDMYDRKLLDVAAKHQANDAVNGFVKQNRQQHGGCSERYHCWPIDFAHGVGSFANYK